MEVLLLKKD